MADNIYYQRDMLHQAIAGAVLGLLMERDGSGRAELTKAEVEALRARYVGALGNLLYEVRHKALIDARDAVEGVDP